MTSASRQWPRFYPGTPDRRLGGKETAILRGLRVGGGVVTGTIQNDFTVTDGAGNPVQGIICEIQPVAGSLKSITTDLNGKGTINVPLAEL